MASTDPASAELVVPVDDAPPALPPDSNGNAAQPFDEAVFLKEQRAAAAEQAWKQMVENEAQARTISATGAANVSMAGPDGQPTAGTAVVPESQRQRTADSLNIEAARQRRVAMALIEHSDVDELDLLAARVRELRMRLESHKRELAVHRDFRDHPDFYGYVMLDGRTPIDYDREVAAVLVLETQIADAEAELGWYAAQG